MQVVLQLKNPPSPVERWSQEMADRWRPPSPTTTPPIPFCWETPSGHGFPSQNIPGPSGRVDTPRVSVVIPGDTVKEQHPRSPRDSPGAGLQIAAAPLGELPACQQATTTRSSTISVFPCFLRTADGRHASCMSPPLWDARLTAAAGLPLQVLARPHTTPTAALSLQHWTLVG